MHRNTKNIIVYTDKNLNRFIVELNNIIICDNTIKPSKFEDAIKSTNSNNKSVKHFCSQYFKGECNLVEIKNKNLGLSIVSQIFNLTTYVNNLDNKSTDVSSDDEIYKNNDEFDRSNNSNNSNKSIKIIKSKNKMSTIDENISTKIVSNIPILLLPCNTLEKSLNLFANDDDKINLIIKHYKNCDLCDITNNNNNFHEINIDDKINIQIQESEYELCLDAYLSVNRYPNPTDLQDITENYVRIYRLIEDYDYKNALLIEFTSSVEILDDDNVDNVDNVDDIDDVDHINASTQNYGIQRKKYYK